MKVQGGTCGEVGEKEEVVMERKKHSQNVDQEELGLPAINIHLDIIGGIDYDVCLLGGVDDCGREKGKKNNLCFCWHQVEHVVLTTTQCWKINTKHCALDLLRFEMMVGVVEWEVWSGVVDWGGIL